MYPSKGDLPHKLAVNVSEFLSFRTRKASRLPFLELDKWKNIIIIYFPFSFSIVLISDGKWQMHRVNNVQEIFILSSYPNYYFFCPKYTVFF